MDQNEVALERILTEVFGLDCWDDSVSDTARRVYAAWKEYTPVDTMPFNWTTFPASVNQLITVRDIEFSSLCAHHLFPYWGIAHVGYVPNKLQVGLSKIPRLVKWLATRPTSQETLTATVARIMKDSLTAHGVAVVTRATHTCMSCRGVREHRASMVVSEMKGVFLTSGEARSEFLKMIGEI